VATRRRPEAGSAATCKNYGIDIRHGAIIRSSSGNPQERSSGQETSAFAALQTLGPGSSPIWSAHEGGRLVLNSPSDLRSCRATVRVGRQRN
jgi:hypothetical protein